MGKYDQYCVKNVKKDNPYQTPGTYSVFTFGKETYADAPYHVEITMITEDCKMMAGTDKGEERKVVEDGDYFYGHTGPYPAYVMEADRYVLFFGTNVKDLRDLGAHVECAMGDDVRHEEEIFRFDEPRCIYVPAGVRFGPVKVSDVRHKVVMVDIIVAPSLKEGKMVTDFTYYSEYRDQQKLKAGKLL